MPEIRRANTIIVIEEIRTGGSMPVRILLIMFSIFCRILRITFNIFRRILRITISKIY